MTSLCVINGSIYQKNDNSFRKQSKGRNHQICRADFGKNPWVFGALPALNCTHGGVHKWVSTLAAGFEGMQPLAFMVVLVWLLHGHKLHQFVTLDEGQCPQQTAVPQLCTWCEHAVIANLVKTPLNWVVQPDWAFERAWFCVTKGGSPGGADHGLE